MLPQMMLQQTMLQLHRPKQRLAEEVRGPQTWLYLSSARHIPPNACHAQAEEAREGALDAAREIFRQSVDRTKDIHKQIASDWVRGFLLTTADHCCHRLQKTLKKQARAEHEQQLDLDLQKLTSNTTADSSNQVTEELSVIAQQEVSSPRVLMNSTSECSRHQTESKLRNQRPQQPMSQ